MKSLPLLFLIIFQIFSANCTVFLWSNQEIDVLPLQEFTDDDLTQLVKKMDIAKVLAYANPNENIPRAFKDLVEGHFSAFTTNDNLLDVDNIVLTGEEEPDFTRIKDDIEEAKNECQNTLFIIRSRPELRSKRDVEDEEVTSTPEPKGAVAYIGEYITDKTKYGIIYSSTSLLLRNNKTDLYLTKPSDDLISVDTVPKESITRLNVNIPQKDGSKILLKFIFSWVDYYWYLTSVRITDTSDNSDYTLAIDKEVYAPHQFSYHCSGLTVFSDPENDVYLYLTDMQVQIGSSKKSFNDAYDCISFTTIPIWSGIIVSSLLLVVMMLSLVALWDIKTMDKFDNGKTKQLTITVNE